MKNPTLTRLCLTASLGLLALMCMAAVSAKTLDVVFLDPGKHDEPFWSNYVRFMQAAAPQLDIRLEVIVAERNHVLQLQQGREVLARAHLPDYLIVVNEKRVAEVLLKEADAHHVPTLLAHVRLDADQAKLLGAPRSKLKHWIGQIESDNVASGQRSAQALFELTLPRLKRQATTPHLLVLNGVMATVAAPDRRQGLLAALPTGAEQLKWQELELDWSRDAARSSVSRSLSLQPDINLIWAANNAMAMGAIDAVKALGRQPGKDIWIAGAALGVVADEAAAVKSGELAATVGGQYLNGAFGLVMLRDLADGRRIGNASKWSVMASVTPAITASNISEWQAAFAPDGWSSLPFRKLLNPKCKTGYQFGASWLIRRDAPC